MINEEVINIVDYIPFDIWRSIFEFCDFEDQIKLRQVNKKFHENLHMTDFYNINKKYLKRLTDAILKNHKHIKYLDVHKNPKVTTVNDMLNLKKLNAGGNCGIGD